MAVVLSGAAGLQLCRASNGTVGGSDCDIIGGDIELHVDAHAI